MFLNIKPVLGSCNNCPLKFSTIQKSTDRIRLSLNAAPKFASPSGSMFLSCAITVPSRAQIKAPSTSLILPSALTILILQINGRILVRIEPAGSPGSSSSQSGLQPAVDSSIRLIPSSRTPDHGLVDGPLAGFSAHF